MNSSAIRTICSLPVILLAIYFIPFLGVLLLITRLFIYSGKKLNRTPSILITIGILAYVPKFVNYVLGLIKFDASKIPYFNDIITSKMYTGDVIKFANRLFIYSAILIIVFYFLNKLKLKVNGLFSQGQNFARNYIENQEKRNDEISRKNDLLMKEKREIAENSKVISCPYCGAETLLTSKTGTCKYCRRSISQ